MLSDFSLVLWFANFSFGYISPLIKACKGDCVNILNFFSEGKLEFLNP